MLILLLYIFHHVVLCLGVASSLIIDVFIIIVEKTRKIKGFEKKIMERIMSFSFLFSMFIFLSQLAFVFFIFMNQTEFTTRTYLFAVITFCISSILVFCTATQKYYQFKILERYQEQHNHLSDSFIKHHSEFKQTSVINFVLWLALYIAYLLV